MCKAKVAEKTAKIAEKKAEETSLKSQFESAVTAANNAKAAYDAVKTQCVLSDFDKVSVTAAPITPGPTDAHGCSTSCQMRTCLAVVCTVVEESFTYPPNSPQVSAPHTYQRKSCGPDVDCQAHNQACQVEREKAKDCLLPAKLSWAPSPTPTLTPTDMPTNTPTIHPSLPPTSFPTNSPTLPPTAEQGLLLQSPLTGHAGASRSEAAARWDEFLAR